MARPTQSAQAVVPSYDHRVRHSSFFSTALGIKKSFYIFVPPDLAADQRVPTLYLLRGHEREWINPHEDSARAGTNVIDVYEALRADGRIGPLILVFPGMVSDDGHVPGLMVNMCAPQLSACAPGIGSGRFHDYFFDDLIPHVDAHFPTLADGRRRGIAGFSLGGAMAIRAAALRPDMFASAGAYDGTFLYEIDRGRRVRGNDPVIRNPMFDAAYGVPRNLRFVADNNAANIILRGDAAALRQVAWMVSYGPKELEPWHANFYRGEHLLSCLHTRGLQNLMQPAVFPGGDHTWKIADAFMAHTLPLHDQVLRQGFATL